MIDRKYLESQPNWQATFRFVKQPDSFDCLMRNAKGGFYWHAPDYKGAFAWGATREFMPECLADSIDRGYMELVAGVMPQLK